MKHTDLLKSYYILITKNGEDANGATVPAKEVVENRLKKRQWPIYKGTRNRKSFSVGDICLIYVGGQSKDGQKIIGQFLIKKIDHVLKSYDFDEDSLLSDTPDKILHIENLEIFEKPLEVKPKLGLLSFIPDNKEKWGVVFMGGSRKINKEDYDLLIK